MQKSLGYITYGSFCERKCYNPITKLNIIPKYEERDSLHYI